MHDLCVCSTLKEEKNRKIRKLPTSLKGEEKDCFLTGKRPKLPYTNHVRKERGKMEAIQKRSRNKLKPME